MAVMLWLGLSGVPLLERRQRSFGVQIQTDALPGVHSLSALNARIVHSVMHRDIPGFSNARPVDLR
jgi:hypothetical protein